MNRILSPSTRTGRFYAIIYNLIGVKIGPESKRIFDVFRSRAVSFRERLIHNRVSFQEAKNTSEGILDLIEEIRRDSSLTHDHLTIITIKVKNLIEWCDRAEQGIDEEFLGLSRELHDMRSALPVLMKEVSNFSRALSSAQHSPRLLEVLDVEPRKYTKEEIQARRDTVRSMVFNGAPQGDIRAYRGRNRDGPAIDFFKSQYSMFIEPGYEVIFSSDLLKIDVKLFNAINNECRGGYVRKPFGTESDLLCAMVAHRFADGANTKLRVSRAIRRGVGAHAQDGSQSHL